MCLLSIKIKKEGFMMKALVLHEKGKLSIDDLSLYENMGDLDVRIAIKNVGICGSDVHYYLHGNIGEYVVRKPMVLGHEAAGTIIEVGEKVKHLKVGDRVCMEPGIPNPDSKVTALGMYNLDPDVVFWATPPVHGCLCENVVHPAKFTFKLPDNVTFAEGAMVEPLAIGLQAADKARIRPGDTAVVFGCGTIGILTALSALAGGCSKVFIADINSKKLSITDHYKNIIPINLQEQDLSEELKKETNGWGADIVFEATGSAAVFGTIHEYACPRGCIVLVGIPASGKGEFSITGLQAKELRIKSVFRYAHKYERAIKLISSGDINVDPLISEIYPFNESIKAYEAASAEGSTAVKIQISLDN
jgi:D-xylulose reductase